MIEVERLTKTGRRTLDARAPVLRLRVLGPDQGALAESDLGRAAVAGGGRCAILQMVVRHTTPSVRPDDILTALHAVTELKPPVPPLVTRLAQGPLLTAGAGVADPLAADKEAVGS